MKKNRNTRLFIIILVLTLLPIYHFKMVYAAEFDDYAQKTFYTYETDDYKNNSKLSHIKYRIEDDCSVTAIGSYSMTKNGIPDETTCASTMVIPSYITYKGITYTVTKTEETFLGKRNVTSVTFPDTIIEIGFYTLAFTSVKELQITKRIKVINQDGIQYNPYLTKITADNENKYFKAISNVLYTFDGKTLVTASNIGNSYTVKNGVEIVRTNAFSNCIYWQAAQFRNSLLEITFPSSIKKLEYGSVPFNTRILYFKGKTSPKVDCDLTGENGPILFVPKGSGVSYMKISYNGEKIQKKKVISSFTTKTSANNKKENDRIMSILSIADGKTTPVFTTKKQNEKIKKDLSYLLKGSKNDTEIIKKIFVTLLNSGINRDPNYFGSGGSVWKTYSNPKKSASSYWIVTEVATVYKILGFSTCSLYYQVEDESSFETFILAVYAADIKEWLYVDILSALPLHYIEGEDTHIPLNQFEIVPFVDNFNRQIFDLNSKIVGLDYINRKD